MSHRDRVAAARAYTRGNLLYRDYERTGDLQVLQAAIGLLGEAVAAVPAGDPDRPGYLSDLGIALQDRYERTGRQADLEQAVSWLSAAVDTAPAGDPDLHRYLSNLGNALRAQFGRTGQLAVLARAIAVGRRAVDAAPARHPSRHMYLFNLGIALRAQFRYAGREPDLDQAIELIRAAVRAAGGGHPDRPAMLSSLGNALQDRFERTGQRADLDEAVAVGQQAADAVPAGSPGRADFLSNLGNALHARFEHTGRLTDLDQAISVGQQAVDAAPAGHIHRPAMLSNLAGALAARFRRTGRLADIGRSITVGRLAVEGTPAGSPALPMYLSNLGTAFQYRFSRTGQFSDLDEAIAAGQQALAAAPADHASRPLFLTNLGNALQVRFARTGQLADLDAAVARLTEAVGASPAGHPGRAAYLSNRGLALLARFLRTGQEADLDEAVTSGRLAVEAIPQGDADQPVHRANLGAALLVRASAGQPADLDEAVTLLTAAAAASPADHPDRALYLTRLGLARRARFDGAGQRADLDAALGAFREAAGIATASPGRRVAAAREWGHCALLHGRPDDALAGYALAVELLPLVAWHGLDQPTREHHLQEWAGLACDAAAAAVAAGQADRAVELLEAGRSVLWTQAARLRQDLAALRIADAGLAAALEASRAILDIAAAGLTSDPVPEDEQQVLARRRQAARDWDDAVDRVRGIDGFRDFLRPTRYADLRAAAVKGAVVIVNVSRHGSHALIVPPPAGPGPDHAVVVAGLPDAPRDIVVQQANILLRAQRRAESPATDPRAGPDDRRAVLDVLDWSWRAIAGPALAALGHTGTPPGRTEDWPRLWWCPTGPATLLPLHAAGRHPGSGSEHDAPGEAAAVSETVAGRVISSYAPTLTVLAQARSRSGPGPVRQLAVGVSEAPGYAAGAGPLPEVPAELRTVGRYVTAPDFATRLLDGAATRQAVLAALPGHSWLHMSCHGFQDRASPSRSAFFLHDQPLTLADLAGLSLGQTDLAYLAACQTAAGDLRLPDEALHLAGALQLAGYRHVLATLWSISDFTAAEMAGIIYAHLAHPDPDHPGESDRPLADRAPYALHHAVSWLRRAHAGDPLRWAPYVHLGP